jgi:spore germination cell wall hydrolase CwlJ-like protein
MDTILLCLALTVFQEARGEPIIGQRAVATVVVNRARIRNTTICDAVLEKGQFSWHPERYIAKVKRSTGQKNEHRIAVSRLPTRAKGWTASVAAAKYALSTKETLQNAEFFHASHVKPPWKRRFSVVFRAGNHVFYARKIVKVALRAGSLPAKDA